MASPIPGCPPPGVCLQCCAEPYQISHDFADPNVCPDLPPTSLIHRLPVATCAWAGDHCTLHCMWNFHEGKACWVIQFPNLPPKTYYYKFASTNSSPAGVYTKLGSPCPNAPDTLTASA